MTQDDFAAAKLAQYKAEHPELYYVAPPGKCSSLTHSPQLVKYYFKRTWGTFGWRFMWHVTAVYFGFKGMLYQLLFDVATPFFNNYFGLSAVTQGNYTTVMVIPYSLKPFWGVVSDVFPIAGWRRRWYLVASAALCTFVFTFLTFVPWSSSMGGLVLLMLGFGCQAIADLYTEAQYAELMTDNPYIGPDIVTWNWLSAQIAAFIVGVVAGQMSDAYTTSGNDMWLRGLFAFGIPFSLQLLLPTTLNWMGETRIPEEKRGIQWHVWRENKDVFKLGLIMGACVVVSAIFNLFGDQLAEAMSLSEQQSQLPLLVTSILISLVAGGATYWYVPRIVANSMVYMFLSSALFIQYGGMNSWYLASPKCLPNGPHFGYTYFTTINGTLQAVFGSLGVLLFQAVMSDWSLRPCFWVTTLVRVVCGSCEVLFVAGVWRKIGIPDHVSYFLGQTLLGQVAYMLDFMPGVVLTSKLCPKGVEGTMYALLAGFSNFGQSIAQNLGTYLFAVANIRIGAHEPKCNDDNLWWVLLIGETITPLICIPLTFVMIPEGKLKGVLYDKAGNAYPPEDGAEEDSESPASVKENVDKELNTEYNAGSYSPNSEAIQYPMAMPTPEHEDVAMQPAPLGYSGHSALPHNSAQPAPWDTPGYSSYGAQPYMQP